MLTRLHGEFLRLSIKDITHRSAAEPNEQIKTLPTLVLTDLIITHFPQSCSEFATYFKKVIRDCVLLFHKSFPVK